MSFLAIRMHKTLHIYLKIKNKCSQFSLESGTAPFPDPTPVKRGGDTHTLLLSCLEPLLLFLVNSHSTHVSNGQVFLGRSFPTTSVCYAHSHMDAGHSCCNWIMTIWRSAFSSPKHCHRPMTDAPDTYLRNIRFTLLAHNLFQTVANIRIRKQSSTILEFER